jgi:hypothetical protein
MPGGKKIMKMMIKRWAHYALPAGFAELGYPKDSNYHMININMTGRVVIGLFAGSADIRRNKSDCNAKFTATPHRRSTVMVKYPTQRIHWKLGRTRKSVHKKFSFNIQAPSITGES